MSSFWNFLFGVILIILWIVAGGFVSQASVFLSPYKNSDENLHRAYWFTFWAAFTTWFLLGLFILLIILSVLGVVALFGSGAGEAGAAAEAGEAAEAGTVTEEAKTAKETKVLKEPFNEKANEKEDEGISWVTIGFLIFALFLVAVTGVLAAIAATDMVKSPNFNPSVSKLKKAYDDCIIAASICLGAGGVLIIGIVVYFMVGYQREKRIEAEKKYQEKQKELELSDIEQLKRRSLREKLEQQAKFEQEVQQEQRQVILERIAQQAAISQNVTSQIPAPQIEVTQETPKITGPQISFAQTLTSQGASALSQVPKPFLQYGYQQLSEYKGQKVSTEQVQQMSQEELQQALAQKVSDHASEQASKYFGKRRNAPLTGKS